MEVDNQEEQIVKMLMATLSATIFQNRQKWIPSRRWVQKTIPPELDQNNLTFQKVMTMAVKML